MSSHSCLRSLLAAALIVPSVGIAAAGTATAADAPAEAPKSCPAPVQLGNPSFEDPEISKPYAQLPQNQVGAWRTTASDGRIEIWHPPVASINGGMEIDATDGAQLAELNATEPSMLYQDVPTVPGQVMEWSIDHRARNAGSGEQLDTMNVLIGAPGTESAQTPVGAAGPAITDTDSVWGTWTGHYTVPAGQTTTRFGFKAVSTGTGNPTVGNFLDNISFGNQPCVTLDKSVAGATGPEGKAVEGDRLTYTLTARNDGTSDARTAVLNDKLPAGTRYVPGSLASGGSPLTDASGDDAGEFASGAVTVRADRVRRAGGTAEATFEVEVLKEAVGHDVVNQATADYGWLEGMEFPTVQSPKVVTPVIAKQVDPKPDPDPDPTVPPNPDPDPTDKPKPEPSKPGTSKPGTSKPGKSTGKPSASAEHKAPSKSGKAAASAEAKDDKLARTGTSDAVGYAAAAAVTLLAAGAGAVVLARRRNNRG